MLAEKFTTSEPYSRCSVLSAFDADVAWNTLPNSKHPIDLTTAFCAARRNWMEWPQYFLTTRHAFCIRRARLRKDLQSAIEFSCVAGNFALHFAMQRISWNLMLKRFFSSLQRQLDFDGILIRQSQAPPLSEGHLRSPPDSLLTDAQPLPSPPTR